MGQFTCPLCKKPFTAPPSAAAVQVRCPHCQKAVEVPATAASRWYLARDKKKYGPYTWNQLLALSRRGDVRPADMLLQEGAKQWLSAETVPGLFATPPARSGRPKPAAAKKPQRAWLIAGLVSAVACVLIAVCAVVGFLLLPSNTPLPIAHKTDIDDGSENNSADPPKKIAVLPKDDPKPDEKQKPPDNEKKDPPIKTPADDLHAAQADTFVAKLNRHRQAAGLELVTLDPELSSGCSAHAKYLARHVDTRQANPKLLDEDPKQPGYTVEGERAGRVARVTNRPAAAALDAWIGSALERSALLNPEMRTIGVGVEKNERGEWFCVVDAVRGRGEPIVVFPAPQQTNVPIAFSGGRDVPDSATAAGFPISISVPPGKQVANAKIDLHDAQGNAIDGWLPHAPKLNAIGLVPKEALQGSTLYQVKASAQIDGKPWSLAWSFTTEDDIDKKGIWAKKTLDKVNAYRASAGLKPVVLDDALSRSCLKHARYLVINEGHPSLQGLKAHQEDLQLPGSSPEGDAAGKASVIAFGDYEPINAADDWMATLYHRVPILEPNLRAIGFGCARGRRQGWATVMNVSKVLEKGERPHSVFYPAPDQTQVPLNFPSSGEEPNPIPDDTANRAGFPVTAFFPKNGTPTNVSAVLTDAQGNAVPCWFSSQEKLANPNFAQHQGNTVCLIAKKPLAPKTTYHVHITGVLAGQAWEKKWQFTTIATGLSAQDAARRMVERLNEKRLQAGLRAVELDDNLSRGCQLHAEYLAKNADALMKTKAPVNDEDPQLPGFTAEGLKTARQSLVFSNAPNPVMQIDDLTATYSSRVFLFDPRLQRVGIGCAHDIGRGWRCVLDPYGGRGDARVHLYPMPKQTDVPLLGFDRLENNKGQLGFPITVAFPQGSIVRKVQAALKDAAGMDVNVAISAPDAPLRGRQPPNLAAVYPLAPLQAGQTYAITVAAIVNGNEWRQSWSFTTQR